MNSKVIDILTRKGIYYLKQDDKFINVYSDRDAKGIVQYKIDIPLFHKIALFASTKKSYKTVLLKFYDDLKHENIKAFPRTKENLENATQAVGKPGGRVAFLLGLFCRFFNKLPRNVNIVWSVCEKCHSYHAHCGNLNKCGDFYGCGAGVLIPLDPVFNKNEIPSIRKKIKNEVFPCPITETVRT